MPREGMEALRSLPHTSLYASLLLQLIFYSKLANEEEEKPETSTYPPPSTLHTRKRLCEDKGRTQLSATERSLIRSQPCQLLHLGLLASVTVRK